MENIGIYFSIYFFVNGVIGYFISNFFRDRAIGRRGVFFVCFLLSPIIGILIGISSRRVTKLDKRHDAVILRKKQTILSQIDALNKEKELGLISESNKTKLEQLRAEYVNMDKAEYRQNFIREREAMKERNEAELRRRRNKIYNIIIFISIALILFIIALYISINVF